jgi:hypothetical protein
MHKRGLKKRLYRNVSIGELKDGQVGRGTDYCRERIARSECRRRLSDSKRPDAEELTEH